MIKVNNPNVSIVIGRVSNVTKGLIKRFNAPNTIATMSAVKKESRVTPGNIYEAAKIAIVDMRREIKIPIHI
jgi:hypothetical protein